MPSRRPAHPTRAGAFDAALAAGDPDGEVTVAWWAAQQLCLAYTKMDLASGRVHADGLSDEFLDCPVPEVARHGRTLAVWRKEFLDYVDTGRASNGPTEAVNLLVEKIRRMGHGYRRFDHYRLRLLLHCGIEWSSLLRPKRSAGDAGHLNFGTIRVFLEADVFRVDCRDYGRVRTEQVPWAPPRARQAQRRLRGRGGLACAANGNGHGVRTAYAPGRPSNRVAKRPIDDAVLDDLYRIGVDEISYRRDPRYLTINSDYQTPASKGSTARTIFQRRGHGHPTADH